MEYMPIILLVTLWLCLNFWISRARIKRDHEFEAVAVRYGMTLTLDYKKYSYLDTVSPGKSVAIRTLSGTVAATALFFQDRISMRASVLDVLPGVYSWSIYFHAPTWTFGEGAETIATINGATVDIGDHSFWSISGFASLANIKSILDKTGSRGAVS